MDLRKLTIRSISGAVYIGIIIGSLFAGPVVFGIMCGLVALLASLEFTKIVGGFSYRRSIPLALDVLGCIALSQSHMLEIILLWIVIMLARFVCELYMKDENPIKQLAYSALMQVYIGIPIALMHIMEFLTTPTLFLLSIFILIWMNDTGAFIIGCTIGRKKLFERISPKKSWEGFWGGFVFDIVAVIFFCYYPGFLKIDYPFMHGNIPFWIGLAVIVTAFSTWGDLIESLFKRTLGIKDSGNIIPGHGGILDRIDSILLVMPACAIYLLFWFI